jgi:hypothetical protein
VRRALNENPLVQAALIGVLAIIVGFLLLTRVMNRNSGAEESAATTDPAAAAPAATDSAAAPPESTDPAAAAAADAAAPSTDPSATPPAAADPATAAAAAGEFVAGPGLPAEVVKAYADGKVVALLIVRENGIEDRKVRAMVETLRSRGDTAVFVTPAATIARYSRITQGVDVERVPALVVIRPRKVTEGDTPVAAVSYGFRGPDSVDQAVRDALYAGRKDIPYYPE